MHESAQAALLCGMTPVPVTESGATVCLLERVNASSLTWPGSARASEAGRTIGGRRGRYSGLGSVAPTAVRSLGRAAAVRSGLLDARKRAGAAVTAQP
jgi:hypothetical protein